MSTKVSVVRNLGGNSRAIQMVYVDVRLLWLLVLDTWVILLQMVESRIGEDLMRHYFGL